MDTVYVIYFDNKMCTQNNRKCAYLTEGRAKSAITSEIKNIAEIMYYDTKFNTKILDGINKYWYELNNELQNYWLDKAKARFEIRDFIEKDKNGDDPLFRIKTLDEAREYLSPAEYACFKKLEEDLK